MIHIEDVSLTLGKASILRHINLDIPKGGITALIGPNGAGKSSLLSLVARLLPLQEGHITIDGLPVDSTPSSELAKRIAIMRQDPHVASRLRVEELVAFGRFPHSRGRLSDHDRLLVRRALERFDLTQFSDRFLETLSGGQRQRALVALAFCQSTDYLLLDEPLNNLDMYYARQLMQILRDIADNHGRTVLIVVHDINFAAAYADRIIAMHNGTVIADGAPAAMLTQQTLKSVFGFDMPVETIDGVPVVLHHR
ncbi:MAG: ATP-binding cassette domain-containing protein [Mesorhizobium sp.]